MNDYLKKARNDKKFDPNRKYPHGASQYNNPQYRGTDKHGKDRRKPMNRKTSEIEGLSNILAEIVTDMKGLLESISQTNKRLADIEERKIETESRKVDALEQIAGLLKKGGIINAESGEQKKEDLFPSLKNRDCVTKPTRPDEDGKDIIVSIINDMRKTGLSYSKIADQMEIEQISTFSGKGKWHSQTIQKICKQYSLKAGE